MKLKSRGCKKTGYKSVKPATKYIKMDELGVKYKEGVTRAEADRLIEKHWKRWLDEFKTNLKLAKEKALMLIRKLTALSYRN